MKFPTIICLVPVSNEAWILERFLACTSLWADVIVVAVQHSDAGTQAILDRFPKVKRIENTSPVFDENFRQKLLIDTARTIGGPRVLIALDADEILSATVLTHPEWRAAMHAAPGTAITFERAELWPDRQSYWLMNSSRFHLGFVDDGTEHRGQDIHSIRIPQSTSASTVDLQAVSVLHYQYTDWQRMQSKQRWYQCWEQLNHPRRHAVDIYRQYHHMYAVRKRDRRRLPAAWLKDYQERGIDMLGVHTDDLYRWDKLVLDLLQEHGPERFSRTALWDVDWCALARRWGLAQDERAYRDPRTPAERLAFSMLARTQPYAGRPPARAVNLLLKHMGW